MKRFFPWLMAAAALGVASGVLAQGAFPDRPVKLIVGFPAGSTADIVARHVPAMLGKVHRRPEVRRAVHAVDEPVDDVARDQLEVADPRQHHGVDEPSAWDSAGCLHSILGRAEALRNRNTTTTSSAALQVCLFTLSTYIPERGTETDSSSRSMSVSVVTPSDCAWKFVRMR